LIGMTLDAKEHQMILASFPRHSIRWAGDSGGPASTRAD